MGIVFEVQISEYLDGNFFDSTDPVYHLNLINMFQDHLEDFVGGMLCLEHFQLPEVQPLLSKGGTWVVKISCCCCEQRNQVCDRVKIILK